MSLKYSSNIMSKVEYFFNKISIIDVHNFEVSSEQHITKSL